MRTQIRHRYTGIIELFLWLVAFTRSRSCLFRTLSCPLFRCLFPRLPCYLYAFVLLCAMRTSPHRQRVCVVLFLRLSFVLYTFFLLCAMRTSPHKQRVCVVLFPPLPFGLYAFILNIPRLTNFGFGFDL